MILGYHIILSAYGFWLPNDPRGSGSRTVRSPTLAEFGPATKVNTERSVAHRPHDRKQREAAKQALKYEPARFTGRQALVIAQGFAQAGLEAGYTFHACAIMPDHAHLVIARHERPINRIVAHLKAKATQHLRKAEIAPATPSPWARGARHRFIDSVAHMQRAIGYVQQNPVKAGLPAQSWSFVQPFEG
jgi:REP element-mobilizing transposase RayT